jgi:fibronectin-binding autotransporter adhesin
MISGTGIVNANLVTLQGGTIVPGTNTVGTLTVNGNLSSAGGFLFMLNKSLAQSNSVLAVSGSLAQTGAGVLTISNLGPALVAGDTFKLLNGGTLSGGSGLTISPAPGAGLFWTNQLAVNGSITVVSSLPNTPTNITASVSGGQLTLSWPQSYTGWLLQSNSISLTVPNDWFTVPGSASTNKVIYTVDTSKTNVFYRLLHP